MKEHGTFLVPTQHLADVIPLDALRIGQAVRVVFKPTEGGPLAEYNWPHGIGEVVTALVRAGLRIEWLREFPRTPYPFPEFLERRPEGDYGWPANREDIPLTFSIGARKPGSVRTRAAASRTRTRTPAPRSTRSSATSGARGPA